MNQTSEAVYLCLVADVFTNIKMPQNWALFITALHPLPFIFQQSCALLGLCSLSSSSESIISVSSVSHHIPLSLFLESSFKDSYDYIILDYLAYAITQENLLISRFLTLICLQSLLCQKRQNFIACRDFIPQSTSSKAVHCGREDPVHAGQAGRIEAIAVNLSYPFITPRLQGYWLLP